MNNVINAFIIAMIASVPASAALAEPNPYDGPVMPKFDFTTDVTPLPVVHQMMKMAKVGPGDFVIDLGSGDGRIPITAAKHYGARALGVDLNPDIVIVARKNAEREGVTAAVQFLEQDVFKTELTGATVVTAVLWPNIHAKLRPILLERLAPGSRVLTNLYHMGEWKADKTSYLRAQTGQGPTVFPIYLWIVPARIEGGWTVLADGRRIDIEIVRKYQFFSGSATMSGRTQRLRNGRIDGTKVMFDLVLDGRPRRFAGQVQPDGTLEGAAWRATRRSSSSNERGR
jgi:precorrin-6B methylase 2